MFSVWSYLLSKTPSETNIDIKSVLESDFYKQMKTITQNVSDSFSKDIPMFFHKEVYRKMSAEKCNVRKPRYNQH